MRLIALLSTAPIGLLMATTASAAEAIETARFPAALQTSLSSSHAAEIWVSAAAALLVLLLVALRDDNDGAEDPNTEP